MESYKSPKIKIIPFTERKPKPIDWDSIRPIYKKLSDELHVLTNSYNIEISPEIKIHLDHLITVIDTVDQSIDTLEDDLERVRLSDAMVDFLGSHSTKINHKLASPELNTKLSIIRNIVHQEGTVIEFTKAAKIIFDYTERKRHTKNVDELISFVQSEGSATSDLTISIMQVENHHAFRLFFARLCMLMGIADLIVDARSDYKKNYIKVKPSLFLYYRLIMILTKDGLKLIWHFPRKISFLFYCIRFGWALLWEKE